MSPKRILLSMTSGALGPLWALLFIVIAFAIADSLFGSHEFTSLGNLRLLSNAAVKIAVPALGMTMIIIAGGIDLSAGTALTLCGTVLAAILKDYVPDNDADYFAIAVAGAVGAALLTGVVCGTANGLLITSTQVVPFVVTLGTMSIYLGIGQYISHESTVSPDKNHIPNWLAWLCYTGPDPMKYGLFSYVPTSAVITLVLAAIVAGILRFTIFGRNLFAIGSNRSTARLCGVPIFTTTLAVYAIAGLLFAIGSLFHFAEVKNGSPRDGVGMELQIIAAVVLGGGSLSGGRGSVLGTLIGAMIIVVIRSGCTHLQISNTFTHISIGAIIIVAVIVDQLRNGMPEWLFRLIPDKPEQSA